MPMERLSFKRPLPPGKSWQAFNVLSKQLFHYDSFCKVKVNGRLFVYTGKNMLAIKDRKKLILQE